MKEVRGDMREQLNALIDQIKVKGTITVFDKDGKVKSTMKVVSVETREDKKDAT